MDTRVIRLIAFAIALHGTIAGVGILLIAGTYATQGIPLRVPLLILLPVSGALLWFGGVAFAVWTHPDVQPHHPPAPPPGFNDSEGDEAL